MVLITILILRIDLCSQGNIHINDINISGDDNVDTTVDKSFELLAKEQVGICHMAGVDVDFENVVKTVDKQSNSQRLHITRAQIPYVHTVEEWVGSDSYTTAFTEVKNDKVKGLSQYIAIFKQRKHYQTYIHVH